MKKLLALMLVLVLAPAANAIVLEISVGGDTAIQDSAINVCPSDILELDIYCSSGYNTPDEDARNWALVVDTAYGTITGGIVHIPPAPAWSSLDGQSAVDGGLGFMLNPGEDGPWGNIAAPPGGTAGPGIYFDGFVFHCVAEGDAVIRLITTLDWETWEVQDTVTIHQVPEPASMLLLGLGGLLLRRRK